MMHHLNARRATMMLLGTAALLFATPAFAGDAHTQGNAVPPGATLPPDVEVVPIFAPGEQIAIACDALQYTKANSDVRVVLTISAEPGETSPGYHQVMATNQRIAYGAVSVRVPKVPDIQNHTFNLDVYVVDAAQGNRTCDAGHVKIENTIAKSGADSEHSQSKQS
jgi:hypothetical protein